MVAYRSPKGPSNEDPFETESGSSNLSGPANMKVQVIPNLIAGNPAWFLWLPKSLRSWAFRHSKYFAKQ